VKSLETWTSALNSTTLMNTKREITLPLFLEMSYPQQFRTEKALAEGGAGVIHIGQLLDPSMRQKVGTDAIVVKFVKPLESLTADQNEALFHSEVGDFSKKKKISRFGLINHFL